MWPFSRPKIRSLDDDIEAAVCLAASEWVRLREQGDVPEALALKLRIGQFASAFKPLVKERFASLRAAPPELMLLIIAEGIRSSGEYPRALIEYKLGIRLPEHPIATRDQ